MWTLDRFTNFGHRGTVGFCRGLWALSSNWFSHMLQQQVVWRFVGTFEVDMWWDAIIMQCARWCRVFGAFVLSLDFIICVHVEPLVLLKYHLCFDNVMFCFASSWVPSMHLLGVVRSLVAPAFVALHRVNGCFHGAALEYLHVIASVFVLHWVVSTWLSLGRIVGHQKRARGGGIMHIPNQAANPHTIEQLAWYCVLNLQGACRNEMHIIVFTLGVVHQFVAYQFLSVGGSNSVRYVKGCMSHVCYCKRFAHPAGPSHHIAGCSGGLMSYIWSWLHVSMFGLQHACYMHFVTCLYVSCLIVCMWMFFLIVWKHGMQRARGLLTFWWLLRVCGLLRAWELMRARGLLRAWGCRKLWKGYRLRGSMDKWCFGRWWGNCIQGTSQNSRR